MASKHPKVETFATLSARVSEYEKIIPQLQMQARQAMFMAAEEKGKYLHVLKLFAAVLEQNMQEGKQTVVLHKTIVDQPDTINITREEVEGGYAYRTVSDSEIAALERAAGADPDRPNDSGGVDAAIEAESSGGTVGTDADGGEAVEVSGTE